MNVLAGADFFTVEVLTWRGLVTYYVLFFLHLESRRVRVAGITRHPDQEWMEQVARSATQQDWVTWQFRGIGGSAYGNRSARQLELSQYFGLHAINVPRAALSKAETVEAETDRTRQTDFPVEHRHDGASVVVADVIEQVSA
jgi:hypothetical protein